MGRPGISVMGVVELFDRDGAVHPVPGSRKRALLSALVLHRARPVRPDVLADAVWGEDVPSTAASALRVHLSELRRVLAAVDDELADVINTVDGGYHLVIDGDRLDIGRFEALAGRGLGATDGGIDELTAALGCWSGEPYVELVDHESARAEVARLDRIRREVAATLARAARRSGDTAVIGTLARQIDLDPHDETVAAALVALLHRVGQREQALALARSTRERLRDELGVVPGPDLTAAEELALEAAPSAMPTWTRPRRRTPLIGRRDEVAAVRARLAEPGIVTLVGPPGVGKTRLAEEVAVELGAQRDGVVWIDAATLDPDGDVVDLAAVTLGLADQAFRPTATVLRERLQGTDPLVVVDNAEHVVDGVVELSEAIQPAGVSLLVTSRIPSGCADEQLVRLHGLRPDGPARELLLACVDRAGGESGSDDDAWSSRMSAALDGLPLAIELAARAVAAHGSDIGIDVLERRFSADAHGRERSLTGTVESSLALLGPDDVDLFERCGRFAGWFVAGDASALVGRDAEPGLVCLAEHSLLATGGGARGPRFRLLAPLRDVARGRLRADEHRWSTSCERHAVRITAEARRAGQALTGPDPSAGRVLLSELGAELDLALDWFEEGNAAELHIELIADLWLHWYLSGRITAGRRRTEAALSTGTGRPAARGDALAAASFLAWIQGDYPTVRRWVTEARELDATGAALPVVQLADATLAWIEHDLDGAEHHLTEAVEVLAERGSIGLERSFVGSMWANVAWFRGDHDAAAARYQDAAVVAERLGHDPSAGLARRHEVLCLALAGSPRAPAAIDHLVATLVDESDPIARCQGTTLAGLASLELGRLDRATSMLRDGVAEAARLFDALSLALGTIGLVRLARSHGHACGVAVGRGWLDAVLGLTGVPLPVDQAQHLDDLDGWLEERADPDVDRRRLEGRALPADQLVDAICPP